MSDQTHSDRTRVDRIQAAWRDRISAELKRSATVEDLGLTIEPDIHIDAMHVQAPDDSGVHVLSTASMRYEPLVRSVDEWLALRSLDPDIEGPALVQLRAEDEKPDAIGLGTQHIDLAGPAVPNVYVPPGFSIPVLRRLISGEGSERFAAAGVLVDPLAIRFHASAPDEGSAAETSVETDRIRNELLGRRADRPVVGCVDALALDALGAGAPTTVAWSLLSLSAWLDSLDAGDLQTGGRLERLRILAPVGNRPIVDAALLTAIRDLGSALIVAYARANNGPDRPVFPVLHAVSARSAVIRSAAPADDAGNLVRTTLQAIAASSAGADILSLLPYDTHRSPDADSIRLCAGIHRMLHHESGLDRTAQPFAGSYAFETIVQRISEVAWTRFTELMQHDSAHQHNRSGLLDRWIQSDQSATEHPVRVGLDKYVPDGEEQTS